MNHDPSQPDPASQPEQAVEPPPPAAAGQPGENESPDNAWFDGDQATPRPPARPRSTRSWIVGGVAAVAIAGGAMFGINTVSSHSASSAAQTMPGGGAGRGPGGMGTQGTITAINGSTITVKTASGTTKVTTGAATTVSVAKTGTVTDIATGDHIMVTGTTSGTKITATGIVDRGKTTTTAIGQTGSAGARPSGAGGAPPSGGGGPQFGGAGRPTDGTVTKVNGSTITIKGTDGKTYTVSTGSSTKITIESTGSLSDLAKGDTVQVMGQTGTTGAITATRIVDGAITGFGAGGAPPTGLSTGMA